MKHFGLCCPAETGHLHTMIPLGRELQRRGHRVTYFGLPDARPKMEAAGLGFVDVGGDRLPPAASAALLAQLGKTQGIPAVLLTLRWFYRVAETFLAEAPAILQQANVTALVVDQLSPEGGTVAEHLGLPFATVCSALPIDPDPDVPPVFLPWPYRPSWRSRLAHRLVAAIGAPLGRPLFQLRARYRRQWGLPPEVSYNSPRLILCQEPPALEFPRSHWPPHFCFTGPYHQPGDRPTIPFPWEQLDGRPLVYASLGTLQNRLGSVFAQIAEACAPLAVQLVISLGGSPIALPPLPGHPIVVSYAPQLELLDRAIAVVTHGGLNTVLECLTRGLPMVVLPITNDQPGVAARVAHAGAGVSLPVNQLRVPTLRAALSQVLTDPAYRQNAQRLQRDIQQAGGLTRAADLLEQHL
ncbi:MAG: glycosyltransferase [Pseudanabaenaceae cyanobacterium]